MKVFLTSAYETHTTLDDLQKLAPGDSIKRHQICQDPEEADAILFVENWHLNDYRYKRLHNHPLVWKFPDKVFMVNEVDKPWCALPGLYSSMPKKYFQKNRQVAFGFFSTPNDFVRQIYKPDDTSDRKFLFSFVGAASHRIRKRIMQLSEGHPSVQDTSDFNVWHCNKDAKASVGQNFASVMANSQFVLCPRGIGTSSFRLFEAMQAGRAPVILADQWVAPPCVDWDFAVRIPESDIESIPTILNSLAGESRERGIAARAAWEAAFAPDRVFNTAIDGIESLTESRKLAVKKIYFQDIRKVFIEGQFRFLYAARPVRDRLRDKLLELSPGSAVNS